MADTAAHLVDRFLPAVAVRQWVLSLPFALRFAVAFDRDLCREVRAIFASFSRKVSSPDTGPEVGQLSLSSWVKFR